MQAQAKAGLLQVSEDKHTKEVKVQRCMRTSSKYLDFHPYKESSLEAPAAPVATPGAKGTTLSGACLLFHSTAWMGWRTQCLRDTYHMHRLVGRVASACWAQVATVINAQTTAVGAAWHLNPTTPNNC